MKKLLLLFVVFFYCLQPLSAQKKFDKWWDEVEAFELEGKSMSAFEAAEKILKKADRKDNSQQFLKAFLYVQKYNLILKDNSEKEVYQNFLEEIEAQESPNKQLLYTHLAESLNQYYQANRWQIRKRTETDSLSDDFKTWTAEQLQAKVFYYYKQSLKEGEQLIKLPLKNYTDVLTYGENYNQFRTTLYDLLSQRYLEYVNSYLSSFPEHPNEPITNENLLALPKEFIKINFEKTSPKSKNLLSLEEYQRLTKLHLNESDELSVVLVTLDRLDYVSRKNKLENEKERYENTLIAYDKTLKGKEEQAWIHLKLAEFYQKNAHKNQHPDYLEKSLSHIETVLDLKSNSNPGKQALRLKQSIINPSLEIKTEQLVLPNRKYRAWVSFKNTDSLYLNIYKMPHDFTVNKELKTDSLRIDFFNKTEAFRKEAFQLPEIDNYFAYNTELLLNELPPGNYVLSFTPFKNPDYETETYYFQQIQVSDIGFTRFDFNEEQQLFVTSRTTGKPLEGVKIKHDRPGNSKYYTTDNQGLTKIRGRAQYYNEVIELFYKGDTLTSNIRFSRSRNYDDPEPEISSVLLTDRSIYRPGQTIYFKGILTYSSEKERKVVPNEKVLIELRDVNDELVESLTLKTNEFGSVQGEFKIPKNVLTGSFELTLDEDFDDESPYYDTDFDDAYTSIQVEEYKRPKFEVEFDELDKSYVLNDSVKLTGKAKAFFGGKVTEAKVTYTMDRSMNYNRPYYRSSYYRPVEDTRILTGETTTNSKGEFTIPFMAQPDSLVPQKHKPVFSYQVEATVTDINGETHTATQYIRIGYHKTELYMVSPKQIVLGEDEKIKLKAEDLNRLKSTASGSLKLFKYETPDRIITERAFNIPEIQTIEKQKFLEHFPYEVYDSLDLKENWPKKFINTVNVEVDSVYNFNIDQWKSSLKSGQYLWTFEGKGANGFDLEEKREMEILQPDNKDYKRKYEFVSFAHKLGKNEIELQFYTPLDELYLFLNIGYDEKLQKQELIQLKKGENIVRLAIPKNSEKVYLHYIYNLLGNYENRYQELELPQPAPEKEKTLEFEVITFKNKLEPGKNEKWQLKIINDQKNPAEAEVLASMYDASLDQFKNHSWNPRLYRAPSRSYGSGLPSSYRSMYNRNNQTYYRKVNYLTSYYYQKAINYSSFKSFGYHFTNAINQNKQYLFQLENEKKLENKDGYITGMVTDDSGLPLPGVNVLIKGTNIGTQTDFDGIYKIKANKNDVLVFNYVGFSEQEVNVGEKSISVSMEAGNELEEVVVSAYSSTIKKNKTAAATTIEAENIENSDDMVVLRGVGSINENEEPLIVVDGVPISQEDFRKLSENDLSSVNVLKDAAATSIYGSRGANGVIVITTKKAMEEELQEVETRTNLQETAFFFPQLKTNKKGEVSFEFDSPEALTRWKFQAFAHDKQAYQAKLQLETVTQKDLNILPNFPRFFRSKDTVVISAKVNNLSEKSLNGNIQLQFTDEISQKQLKLVTDVNAIKSFSISSKGNDEVSWTLVIPENLSAVRYRIVAKAGNFSDGEESVIPVLTNRIFVTETLPIWVNPNEKKTFVFENLQKNNSTTLDHHQLVFEYTSNPVWTALQALPYLIEYPYECSEQTFSRFYGNYLAGHLIQQNPKIQEVLTNWKNNNTQLSELYKNEELKALVLQETPWLKSAESEEEQQKRLAKLLDLKEAEQRAQESLLKLKQMQMASGGFPWFNGGRENLYISLYILKGLGRLQALDNSLKNNTTYQTIAMNLVNYVDQEYLKNRDFNSENFSASDISYLYARTFFKVLEEQKNFSKKVLKYYQTKWIALSINAQLQLAMVAHHEKDSNLADAILESLRQNAVINSEYGMYWKEVTEAPSRRSEPIAVQAFAIEAFYKIANDQEAVNQLKTYLLRNKKTEAWSSTKSTTEAIYALFIDGTETYENPEKPTIKIGGEKLEIETNNASGYFKKKFEAEEISAKKAEVKIDNPSNSPQYGGYYWQYFEESEEVEANNQSALTLQKELFLKTESNQGTKLKSLNNQSLKVGDLLTVRLVITAKESFSFMHLKDMRAAGLEPVDVISNYKWQDGLGYYQSTKDAATNFFFDELPKGTYVFEYDLRVNNPGNFSNGISQLKSMYAPEFSVQSKGQRIEIEKN